MLINVISRFVALVRKNISDFSFSGFGSEMLINVISRFVALVRKNKSDFSFSGFGSGPTWTTSSAGSGPSSPASTQVRGLTFYT